MPPSAPVTPTSPGQQQNNTNFFTISPPTTTNDDGSPSESCFNDTNRVLQMIEDERHICALSLLNDIIERCDKPQNETAPSPRSPSAFLKSTRQRKAAIEKMEDIQKAKILLEQNKDILLDLEERCRLFERAKQNLNINDDWTLAQTLFGITTYYRREYDGSLSIKLEGDLEGVPLFDQVAVLREVDLHCKWAPFCSSSLTIAHLAKLDTVGWFVVGLPQFGLMRDACFRVLGTDSIQEDGSILLVGTGIADRQVPSASLQQRQQQQGGGGGGGTATGNETVSTSPTSITQSMSQAISDQKEFEYLANDPILNGLEIPDAPTRMGSGRMTIRKFQAIVHVNSPTLAKTKIIANIDPNLPLIPQSLLDFLMKKLCGVLLNKLQHAAKKVSKDPIYNPHACKMREEEGFYKNWLMPKFQAVCKIRGWKMPPVNAFELSEQQLEQANNAAEPKRNRNRAIKLYHSLSGDKLDELLENPHDPHHHRTRNLSLHSEPADVGRTPPPTSRSAPIRAMETESDSLSDLSHNSSTSMFTLWKNNPISVYMRELEDKTQLRKARAVEKARQRAANRLKPKELDQVSNSRLKQLQHARQRRALGERQEEKQKQQQNPLLGPRKQSVVFPKNATKSQRSLIVQSQQKRDWPTFWTSHNLPTRILVVSFLVSVLFALLYMDPLFHSYMSVHHGDKWEDEMTRNVVTMVYLSVSAFVHFVLCYVALMYAFSSLQIGSIAGREARRYYSENIHLAVGIASGSMIFAGVSRATILATCRWMIWRSMRGLNRVKDIIFNPNDYVGIGDGLALPNSLQSTAEHLSFFWGKMRSIVGYVSAHVFSTFAICFSWICDAIFDSNYVGRSFLSLVSLIFKPFQFATNSWNQFVDNAISLHEGGNIVGGEEDQGGIVPIWREDVYATTRALLSYSAFFLLVLLVLFNLLAKSARSPSSAVAGEDEDDDSKIIYTTRNPSEEISELTTSMNTAATTPVAAKSFTSSSSRSGGIITSPPLKTRPRTLTKSLSPIFDTIHEGSDEGGGGSAIRSPRSLGTPSSSKNKKKRSKKKSFLKISPSKTPTTAASSM